MNKMVKDLSGMTFGRWKVVKFAGINPQGRAMWLVSCACKQRRVVQGTALSNGSTVSCGCARRDFAANLNKTHGLSKTKEYRIWNGIKSRCYNPRAAGYRYYGALGVKMSAEWKKSFEAFYRDMGRAPSTASSVERKDPNGGYNKENCIWLDKSLQGRNKRNSVYVSFSGERVLAVDAAKALGLKKTTIYDRIKRGIPADKPRMK